MALILTLMFSFWELKRSINFTMYGPSPPVSPFQKSSSTLGPEYSAPPPPVWGLVEPPQPDIMTSPAPAIAPTDRNSRRVKLRFTGRSISTFSSLRMYPYAQPTTTRTAPSGSEVQPTPEFRSSPRD